MSSAEILEHAPAKLNLALHVTGQRQDGYHLLDSLVCFAAVGDELRLSPGPLSLEINGPFSAELSCGDDNLCLRAARFAGGRAGLRLTKVLPVASGLGGGSADAAATLRGLRQMGFTLPDGLERLGADVPVCIGSTPARMQGIGEKVTSVPALPPLHLVLVNPGISLSTPQVFSQMETRQNQPLPAIPAFPEAAALIDWLRNTRNDLEAPAIRLAPAINDMLLALTRTGASFARMSGSGATCFGVFGTVAQAESAAARLQRNGWWAVHTELAQSNATG